VAANDHLTVFV